MSTALVPPRIVLVAAVADNGVIGANDALPWTLKSDMAHFRALTLGRPIIMGRKTFSSIGKALGGRTNIVLTRDKTFRADGVVAVDTLDGALAVAQGDAMRRSAAEIAVIGGADIYAQLMDRADCLEITQVHASPQGDTAFPPRGEGWREVARERHEAGPRDSAPFSFVTYRRA